MSVINPLQLHQLSKFMTLQQIHALLISFLDPEISGREKLISAFNDENPAKILEMAHFLKGAASLIGMQGIVDNCQNIEQQLKENPTPHLNELLLGFEKIWQETELVIQQFMADGAKP